MNETEKKSGGRPRTGYLEFRSGSWHAQVTLTIDRESVCHWVNLKTASKPAARAKLRRLLAQNAAGGTPTREAVAEEAKRAGELRRGLQAMPRGAEGRWSEGRKGRARSAQSQQVRELTGREQELFTEGE